MRSIFIGVFALAVVLSVGSMTQAQMIASLCEYTPPQNQLQSLTLSGDYRYFEDRYLDDRGNASVGHLVLQGVMWSEGPEWSYNLTGSARLELASQLALSTALMSEGSLRRSLDKNLFLFGGVDTASTPFQEGFTVQVLGGIGAGRFNDVTPLAKAMQISRALQEAKILAQPLSDTEMKAIADVIARQPELGLVGVLEGIEQQLGQPLGVSGVIAIRDIVESRESRFCGWDATLALGYTVISPTGETNALARVAANFATPPDAVSQVLAQARLYIPLPFTGNTWLTVSASYARLLTPTTNLSLAYVYTWARQGGQETQAHSLDATLRFLVSPPLSVLVKGQVSLATGYEEPEWGISVGFEYSVM